VTPQPPSPSPIWSVVHGPIASSSLQPRLRSASRPQARCPPCRRENKSTTSSTTGLDDTLTTFSSDPHTQKVELSAPSLVRLRTWLSGCKVRSGPPKFITHKINYHANIFVCPIHRLADHSTHSNTCALGSHVLSCHVVCSRADPCADHLRVCSALVFAVCASGNLRAAVCDAAAQTAGRIHRESDADTSTMKATHMCNQHNTMRRQPTGQTTAPHTISSNQRERVTDDHRVSPKFIRPTLPTCSACHTFQPPRRSRSNRHRSNRVSLAASPSSRSVASTSSLFDRPTQLISSSLSPAAAVDAASRRVDLAHRSW
jgi:hypothetical protein